MNRKAGVRLVTIVAEAVLAPSIIALLKETGVSGYTLVDASGEGSRGRRTGEIPGDNVRVETLVALETADALLAQLSQRWFADYAVVAWVVDAEVVRDSKFS